MKILCIIPPHIPSYFNAGHHLGIFLVSSYLRRQYPDYTVNAHDFAALNKTWKEVCDILMHQYDVIYTHFDYDSVDTIDRFVAYVRAFSPRAKLIAFGRLVKEIPQFFLNHGFDAAQVSGDYECGIVTYMQWLQDSSHSTPGLVIPNQTQPSAPGLTLSPEEWVFPDVEEIPYDSYHYLYKNDLNKFCGIPDRQELVVPVARGCPVGCFFCDVPRMQGLVERRASVSKTITYITQAFNKLPFEYFTFYAPTFTLEKRWVKEFCSQMQALPRKYAWKCVTVLKTLTSDLLQQMAAAGCVRVSFGIESFDEDAGNLLPKIKQNTRSHFNEICNMAKECGVEINVFLILGLDGDNPERMKRTIDICMAEGIRIRPTLYTPYEKMHTEMSVAEIAQFNRQLFVPNILSDADANAYYQIFYNNVADRPTQVTQRIGKYHESLAT